MKLRRVYPTWERAVEEISTAFNNVFQGGSVTLTNSSTTSVVLHGAATANSLIFLMPTNAAASTETPYISAKGAGTFTITHANAGTTRTFDYLITNK